MNPIEIEDACPLTPLQQGMWLHGLSAPGSPAYLEQVIVRSPEAIDRAALELAWEKVVAGQPVLRTTFRFEETGSPVQEVQREMAGAWVFHDWSSRAPDRRDEDFAIFLASDRKRKFPPAPEPLWRMAIVQFAPTDFRFVWSFHHALLDGRSVKIVVRDLFDCYDAIRRGEEPELAPGQPYGEFVRWLQEADLETSKAYWQKMLAGISAASPLLVGHVLAEDDSSGVEEISLSRELTDSLGALVRGERLTLNTLAQGAWAEVLARVSGETDIVFGNIRAGRSGAPMPLNERVGLFMNTVPLRITVRPDLVLRDFLRAIRSEWIAMRPHERVPLATIQKWSDTPSATSLFSSLLVFERETLEHALHAARPEWSEREFIHRSRTEYPLTLSVCAEPTLRLRIRFDTARFDRVAVRGLLSGLRALLENTAADLDKPLRERALLSAAEFQQVVIDWNGTARIFPNEKPAHVLFEEQSARSPEAIALVAPARSLTFAQLNTEANQLAHHLIHRGVRRGDVVAIFLKRSPEIAVAVFAIMKAGAAWLAIDAGNLASRLDVVLQDAKPTALITLENLAPAGSGNVAQILLDRDHPEIAPEKKSNPEVAVAPEDPAFAVYTSGSTGKPKGSLLRHRSLTNFVLYAIERYGITAADRRLQFVSPSSDVFVADLFPQLLAGGGVVFRPEQEFGSLQEFLRFVETHRVTVVSVPSAYWHEWVEALAAQRDVKFPACVRLVIASMDKVRPDLFAIWRSKIPPTVRWLNIYGPSEACVAATVYEPDLASRENFASVPIGRPLANAQVYILDQDRNPLPVGLPGEIYVGGRGVAFGYINRPEETAERFLKNPFVRGEEAVFYRTGDFGRYRADGNIEFIGRRDHQVKIRGYRVELGEVEIALTSHPAVKEAAVVLQKNERGFDRLLGFATLGLDHTADPTELRDFLRPKLPHYMVPAALTILEALPLTGNGKIDRRTLAKTEIPTVAVEPETPLTSEEQKISAIWRDVLGVETAGRHQNFFELGGDSLQVVRLLTAIAEQTGTEVTLETFLHEPTIAGLARHLSGDNRMRVSAVVPIRAGDKAKTPIYFLHLLDGDVLHAFAIAHHLSPAQPVFALQPPTENGAPLPEKTIVEIAARYVRELQALRPHGPLVLAGFSWGAHLAHEMARQFADLGRSDIGLVIIDTPPTYERDFSARFAPEMLRNVPLWMREEVFHSSFRKMRARARRKVGRFAKRLRHWRSAERDVPLVFEPEDFTEINHFSPLTQKLYRLHWAATQNHAPQSFGGQVTLFRAEARPLLHSFSRDIGWDRFAGGSVEIIPVPGHHHTLIEHHARELGEALQSWLDRF